MKKKESWKKVHVTPCCKTRHWHSVISRSIPEGTIRCEMCHEMFDGELLEEVIRGLNPVTYFCDRCGISAEILERQGREK